MEILETKRHIKTSFTINTRTAMTVILTVLNFISAITLLKKNNKILLVRDFS